MIQSQCSHEDFKNVHTLGAENVHKSSTILCGGKLQTLKFTYQQIKYAMFTETGSLFSPPTETLS